jgi:hypothetical protein
VPYRWHSGALLLTDDSTSGGTKVIATSELSLLVADTSQKKQERTELVQVVSSGPEPAFDDPADLQQITKSIRDRFEVHSWKNAATILVNRHNDAWKDIERTLAAFSLRKSHLSKLTAEGKESPVGGRNKSQIAAELDRLLARYGWYETLFETSIHVKAKRTIKRERIGKKGKPLKKHESVIVTFEEINFAAPTHQVDCYRDRIALEVEWNNKNPFFDRDLNNFRLLFELRAIEVGVIVTRCDELDDIFRDLFGSKSANQRYGKTTTRMSKLIPLIKGGGGGGCPILVFGINKASYDQTV